MSYQTAQWIYPKAPFSEGYVDNTQSLYLKDGQSTYLRNARLDWQSITIRPWHSLFASLTAGSYPKGIGSYLRTSAANDVMVVRHNTDATHKLYTLDASGALTSISTGANIASDNRMIFQNVADVIYCMNGSDYFGKLSGTTYTVPSTWVSNFAPAFSVVFNGSHWASGWSTNPNKAYKSVADNYEDFNSTGADTYSFQETITGLSANLEALFYFTKNTISVTGQGDITDTAGTLTFANRALNVKEGSVNHASIVEAGINTFYVTPSNKICKITKGQNVNWFEVLELSERPYKGISTIMSTLDIDQTASFGYYLPKENLIKWFFKTSGATFNDVCIIYDITKDAFLVDSQKFFYDGLFFKGVNYTISMLEPKVYQDEYAQDDEDSPIPFEYWTKEFYISDPTYKKILWETRTLLDINELASCTQEIWIDWGLKDTKTVDIDNFISIPGGIGTQPVGEFAIGEEWEVTDEYQEITLLRTKWNLNKKGKKIQFRYSNNTLAGKVRLKSLSMKIEVLDPLTTNLTV